MSNTALVENGFFPSCDRKCFTHCHEILFAQNILSPRWELLKEVYRSSSHVVLLVAEQPLMKHGLQVVYMGVAITDN